MSIKRKRSPAKKSWFRRLWEWVFFNGYKEDYEDEEKCIPEPPEALPAKDPAYRPQGQIYKMLDTRPQQIAGNSVSKRSDIRVYNYCGVVFYKADQVYHYLNPGIELHVGDRVEAPVHIHGKTELAVGLVVSSGEYLAECVPYPVGQTSMIVRKR